MFWCHTLLLAAILLARASHGFHFGGRVPGETRLWASPLAPKASSRPYRRTRSVNKGENPSALDASMPAVPRKDLSAFEVGRELSGQVTEVTMDGVTVSINDDVSVWLPKSHLTASQVTKAKQLLASKSSDAVQVVLTSIDGENGVLKGKWASSVWKLNPIKEISSSDYAGKVFKGEVMSVHSYGIFVKLKELDGVSGMLPAAFAGLPRGSTPEKTFSVGSLVDVQIVDINVSKNQITLRRPVRPQPKFSLSKDISTLPRDRWMDAIITGVNKYAAFLKIANRDVSAFLHQSQVPADLVAFLRSQLAVKGQTLKTSSASSPSSIARFDMDNLFHEGDIIKVRVTSSEVGDHSLQITMLPWSTSSDERAEDAPSPFERGEYQMSDKQIAHLNALVEYFSTRHDKRSGRSPSSSAISGHSIGGAVGTQQGAAVQFPASRGQHSTSSERSVHTPCKATDLLVWWNQQPISSIDSSPQSADQALPSPDSLSSLPLDEDFFFALEQEDAEIRAGTRRRWMETSLRQNPKSFSKFRRQQDERSSQSHDRLLQSLQEKLENDAEGFGIDRDYIYSQGMRWDLSSCPTEWVQPFLEKQQEKDRIVDRILRRGQKAEEEEFRALVEKWAEESSARGGRSLWKKVSARAPRDSSSRPWASTARREREASSEEA